MNKTQMKYIYRNVNEEFSYVGWLVDRRSECILRCQLNLKP